MGRIVVFVGRMGKREGNWGEGDPPSPRLWGTGGERRRCGTWGVERERYRWALFGEPLRLKEHKEWRRG